jgi:serine/threonine protein phosphatase PrpC
MLTLEVSELSRVGGRNANEDTSGYRGDEHGSFFVLSDGAGGHGAGDVASRLAVQYALDFFKTSPQCSPDAVRSALDAANRAIVIEQSADPHQADMRATAVVLSVDPVRAVAAWGHLGDSRLYCFRQRRIIAQTRDHSLVQGMVDEGLIQPHQLRTAPGRNQLLAALGDADHFDPDIVAKPFDVRDGDVFLLCSDGWWEYVTEDEMEQSLLEAQSAQSWLDEMARRIAESGHPRQDNYSALAVWCMDDSEATWPGLSTNRADTSLS